MFAAATGPKGLDWFLSQAFGSDELTAYTAEYTWNSNQMAHAMMGFALAVVWLRLAISRWERYHRRRDADATHFRLASPCTDPHPRGIPARPGTRPSPPP